MRSLFLVLRTRGSVLADDSCLEVITFATCQRIYYTRRVGKKSPVTAKLLFFRSLNFFSSTQWNFCKHFLLALFLLTLHFPLPLNLQCILRYHSEMPFELSCLLYFGVSKGLLLSSQMETFPFLFSFPSFLLKKCQPQKHMQELL